MSNCTSLQRTAAAAAFVLATTVSAQTGGVGAPAASPERAVSAAAAAPRIALALSGGGARGIAHVGVLKVLDEMRIPICCVTGTSMGSIVGGGLRRRKVARPISRRWCSRRTGTKSSASKPSRAEIAIRRKADDYKTLFAPEFGVKESGLALPKGVIAGVSIEAFCCGWSQPASGIRDFDKLPVPYRAVATDIGTGEAVVLSHGNIAEAMRASMSVPGAIRRCDGRPSVGRRHDRQQPADRPGTQALRRRGDRRQHRHAAAEARRDHLRACACSQMMAFLGKQTVDEQSQEPRTERRADRARPRRHLGRQVRPRQGRDPHRRGGHAEDGGIAGSATASRPSSTRRSAAKRVVDQGARNGG